MLGRLLLYFFEHRMDIHAANRVIPALIPLGLAALLVSPWLGDAHQAVVVLFVVLFGIGNGMLTIVKGTAMAEYVSVQHVAVLNGLLGLPLALVRAVAPLALGWAWSLSGGYGGALHVWDLGDRNAPVATTLHTDFVRSVVWIDDRTCVSVGYDSVPRTTRAAPA